MSEPQTFDWRHQIQDIARGWLFSDLDSGSFPESVIIPFENPDLHEGGIFHEKITEARSYRCITIGIHRGRSVGVLKSKFGAPAVAMAIEVLANMNVRTIVGIGFCGGLRPDIQCGDLVLPLASVRDDGTTARYIAEGYPAVADVEALNLLCHEATLLGCHWHCGLVWSTDTVMLETNKIIEHWSKSGVIAVDMETGALLTIARLHGVRAAAVLVASDNPTIGSRADPVSLSSGIRGAVDLGLALAAIPSKRAKTS